MTETPERACRICGSTDEPTDEHIIPQAPWRCLDIDPHDSQLARLRTTQCGRHNQATRALQQPTEVLDPLERGTIQEMSRHTGIIVGSIRSTLSRSSHDFPDRSAHDFWDQFADELGGKGWWR